MSPKTGTAPPPETTCRLVPTTLQHIQNDLSNTALLNRISLRQQLSEDYQETIGHHRNLNHKYGNSVTPKYATGLSHGKYALSFFTGTCLQLLQLSCRNTEDNIPAEIIKSPNLGATIQKLWYIELPLHSIPQKRFL